MRDSEWTTSGTTLRMTTTGTLVGLPAMRSEPSRGSDPIVPCDDPEEDENALLSSPWRLVEKRAPAPPLPLLPTRRVMAVDERRLLTHAAVVASIVVAILAAMLWAWS